MVLKNKLFKPPFVYIWIFIPWVVFIGICCVFLGHNLLASLNFDTHSKIQLKIDDINYGFFDDNGIEYLLTNDSLQEYIKISLQRSFITEPSLSLWAKGYSSKKFDGQDIYLLKYSASGKISKKYLLKSCYPISWSLETSFNIFGGFQERVDLFVTKVINDF